MSMSGTASSTTTAASPQSGPDFEGQIRRLRSGDGVYFTKAGARKLAHYVEREIQRTIANRALPMALPAPEPTPAPGAAQGGGRADRRSVRCRSGGTAHGFDRRPTELLGGGPNRPAATADPVAVRVLTKGEPIAAPTGRADDFSWPRNSMTIADPPPPVMSATPPAAGQGKGQAAGGAKAGDQKQKRQQQRPAETAPRPPGAVRPSASAQQGAVR